jgi:hypothetical protein
MFEKMWLLAAWAAVTHAIHNKPEKNDFSKPGPNFGAGAMNFSTAGAVYDNCLP